MCSFPYPLSLTSNSLLYHPILFYLPPISISSVLIISHLALRLFCLFSFAAFFFYLAFCSFAYLSCMYALFFSYSCSTLLHSAFSSWSTFPAVCSSYSSAGYLSFPCHSLSSGPLPFFPLYFTTPFISPSPLC